MKSVPKYRKHPVVIKLCMLCLLGFTTISYAAADNIPVVKIGDRIINLPPPNGLVSVHTDKELTEEFIEDLADRPVLKYLAGYISIEDAARHAQGKDRNYYPFAQSTMPATEVNTSVSKGGFKILTKALKNILEAYPKAPIVHNRKNEIEIFPGKQEYGKEYFIEEISNTSSHYSAIIVTRFSSGGIELTSLSQLLVNDRSLNVYITTTYENSDSLKWMKATTLDWLRRIEIANSEV